MLFSGRVFVLPLKSGLEFCFFFDAYMRCMLHVFLDLLLLFMHHEHCFILPFLSLFHFFFLTRFLELAFFSFPFLLSLVARQQNLLILVVLGGLLFLLFL